MENPLVSVIIPCYNQGKYLNDAVTSAINSTYNNIEIIIVDDESDDELTKQIMNDFKKEKAVLIRQKHSGVSAARNLAIQNAKGKYILPLDADDKIHSTYIEKAVKILENNPEYNVVYSNTQHFGDCEHVHIPKKFDKTHLLLENCFTVSVLFKKSDWEIVGGFKEEMDLGWEDWEFWISMSEHYLNPYYIPEELFFYRIVKNEKSRTDIASIEKNKLILRKKLMKLHPDAYIDNIEYLIFPILFEFMKEIPAKIKYDCTKKLLQKLFFSKRTFKHIYDIIQLRITKN